MDEEATVKKINYHNKNNGVWCRWSVCTVAPNYSKTKCPDQCSDSKIIEVGENHG